MGRGDGFCLGLKLSGMPNNSRKARKLRNRNSAAVNFPTPTGNTVEAGAGNGGMEGVVAVLFWIVEILHYDFLRASKRSSEMKKVGRMTYDVIIGGRVDEGGEVRVRVRVILISCIVYRVSPTPFTFEFDGEIASCSTRTRMQ
mmetsp:Transcript_21302/g.39746  ORF Transcript_21302/g.39746 Transcript_21302/m.39746 type:complete len:143 (-) Transcript_21302:5-433(-)